MCQNLILYSLSLNQVRFWSLPSLFGLSTAHEEKEEEMGVKARVIWEGHSIWNQNVTTSKFHKVNSYLGCSQFLRVPQKRFNVKSNP